MRNNTESFAFVEELSEANEEENVMQIIVNSKKLLAIQF